MTEFHFYHELKKDKYYEPLIPEKKSGLVIIYLYDQWKSGKYLSNNFTENAIKRAIEQVASDLGKSYENTQHERFRIINRGLQEYFLFRNEETNLYHITQYGIEFCESIRNKIELEFNPSVIEKILSDLISLLKASIANNDFEYWYNHHFQNQKPYIKRQVETLLKLVEKAVQEFRASTKSDDEIFIETVRKVDNSLEAVRKHSDELKDVFFDAEEIKSIIIELSFDEYSLDLISQKESVRSFIEEINNDLSIINQRIEKIRPKLRQFISSINQRNFDRNTEHFLQYLLKNSYVSKDSSKNKVYFPTSIEIPELLKSEIKFTIVESDRLKDHSPVSVVQPKENKEKQKIQLEKANNAFLIRNRIRLWLMKLEKELRDNGNINFTPHYFQILEEEQFYSKTIAIKVASGLFRKYSKLRNYKVSIKKELQTNEKYPDQGIWDMNIEVK
ncbi:hypothetical protein [uncultured Chryseobacterium sp.]|uniref:hypothetical protein n=1 Tax=uncultured Chryseobacterium sp. TaxID=259322 RepID=UPI00258C26F5|nr:hypothetical protein [uncultured Chryseobacterium sp.]